MNVNFQYSKTLAIEGSILLLLGLIPTVGWVLGIVGIILLFRATKELSSYYQDESIHQNAWTGLKYYIVALIALAVGTGIGITSFVAAGLFTGTPFAFTAGIVGGIIAILAGLAVAFVFYLLAAVHLRKSYEHTRTENGRAILYHSIYARLYRRNTNHHRHWRTPYTGLMDICHNWLLYHEAQRLPTIQCANKRLRIHRRTHTANTGANS